MPYRLFCLIPSSKNYFSVKINKTDTVDELKEKIKEKKPVVLEALDADALTLYRIDVKIHDTNFDDQIEAMCKSDFVFTPKEFLIPMRKVSHYFKNDSEMAVEVLVVPPQGESIDPRMCRRG